MDGVQYMFCVFLVFFGSDIDHLNSATPELTVLWMEAPHTEGMRPIHSSHLAAIILSAENHESRMLKKDTV